MSLKLGSEEDIPYIRQMCYKFVQASPYDDEIDIEKVDTIINEFVFGDRNEKIAILALDEHPVGMVVGLAQEMLFSKVKFSTEVMWWVEPEYRRSTHAKELKAAFEFWSKRVGCRHSSMALLETDQADRIAKVYKRSGYRPVERTFMKELF